MKYRDIYGYPTKREPKETLLYGEIPFPGETIEQKVARITLMGEPIEDGSPTLYDAEGEEDIDPRCDIRRDKWEIAEMEIEAKNRANAEKTLDAARAAGTMEKETKNDN